MISKHFTVAISTDNTSWTYQTVALNDTDEAYDRPFSLIISNKSTGNIIVAIYSKNEVIEDNGTPRYETTTDGLFIKAGGQLQLSQINDIYRVGVRHEVTEALASECIFTCLNYGEIRKSQWAK